MTELNAGEVTVRIDGVPVAVESVRVRSEIASDVAMFTGGNGLVEAEADVTWAPPSGLMTTSEHPWLPSWDKSVGRTVTIDVDGLGDTTWRVFTGTITETHANLGDGTVTSTCTGYETRLNTEVTVPPVAWKMPPVTPGAAVLRPGMTSPWVTGHILAQCGFYAHQPWQPTRVVAASMMGSLWPETGILQAGYSTTRTPVGSLAPHAAATAWGGVACRDPYAKWRGRHTGSATDPWTLAHDLGDPTVGTNYTVRVVTPFSGEGFGLRVTQTAVFVQRYTVAAGAWADVPGLTLTRAPDSTRVQVQYIAGELELALDRMVGGEFQPAPVAVALAVNHTVAEVTVNGTGDVGAVQVYRSVTPVTHEPRTAVFRRDLSVNTIGVVRYLRGNALSLLMEQSRSERIPMWVDDNGVFQCADRETLDAGPVRHVFADAPELLRDLWLLPANRFTNPLPVDTTGFTAGPSTTIGVSSGETLPYLVVANAGSSASTLGRYAEVEVPVTEGVEESWSVMARSPSGARATIHVEFIHPLGGFISDASVTGSATTLTNQWERIEVTATVPVGAAGARIRVGNAGSMPFNTELHFRGFTTLGPPAVLEAISARSSSSDVYGRVVVDAEEARVSVSDLPRFELWRGPQGNMVNGDEVAEFISPPDGVTWLSGTVDTNPGFMGQLGTDAADINRGRFSWVGGHIQDDDDGTAIAWAEPTNFAADFELIEPDKVLYTASVFNLAAGQEWNALPLPHSPTVWDTVKKVSATVLRGSGIASWAPVQTVVDLPTSGPDYVLDGGWWLQSEERRQAVADEAAAHLADPQPVLEGVQVGMVPVRLGERIFLHLTDIAGLTIDAVVIRRDVDLGGGGVGVDVRVLSAEVTSLTLPQIPDVDDFLSA